MKTNVNNAGKRMPHVTSKRFKDFKTMALDSKTAEEFAKKSGLFGPNAANHFEIFNQFPDAKYPEHQERVKMIRSHYRMTDSELCLPKTNKQAFVVKMTPNGTIYFSSPTTAAAFVRAMSEYEAIG